MSLSSHTSTANAPFQASSSTLKSTSNDLSSQRPPHLDAAIHANNTGLDRLGAALASMEHGDILMLSETSLAFIEKQAISDLHHALQCIEHDLGRSRLIQDEWQSNASMIPNRRMVEMQSLSTLSPVSNASSSTRFVFAKAFKLGNIQSHNQMEVAAGCIIFNLALVKHLFALCRAEEHKLKTNLATLSPYEVQRSLCMQEKSSTALMEAAQLYRLALNILQQQDRLDPHSGAAFDILMIVAMSNLGAALASTANQSHLAYDTYHQLMPLLSLVEGHRRQELPTKKLSLLDELMTDMDAIANSCVTMIFHISDSMIAAAA